MGQCSLFSSIARVSLRLVLLGASLFFPLAHADPNTAIHDLGLTAQNIQDLNQQLPRLKDEMVLYHWCDSVRGNRWINQGYVDAGEVDFLSRPTGQMQAYGPGIYLADTVTETQSYGTTPVAFVIQKGTLLYDPAIVTKILGKPLNNIQMAELGQVVPFIRRITGSWYLTSHASVLTEAVHASFFGPTPKSNIDFNSLLYNLLSSEAKKDPQKFGYLESFWHLTRYMDGISLLRAVRVNSANPWAEFEPGKFEAFRNLRDSIYRDFQTKPHTLAANGRWAGTSAQDAWVAEQIARLARYNGVLAGLPNPSSFRNHPIRAGGSESEGRFLASRSEVKALESNPYLAVKTELIPDKDQFLVSYTYPDYNSYQKLKDRLPAELVSRLDAAHASPVAQDPIVQGKFTEEIIGALLKDALKKNAGRAVNDFELYRNLVSIHPFGDFNGRSSRLFLETGQLEAGLPVTPQYMGDEDIMTSSDDFKKLMDANQKSYSALDKELGKLLLNTRRSANGPDVLGLPFEKIFDPAAVSVGLPAGIHFTNEQYEMIRTRKFQELINPTPPADLEARWKTLDYLAQFDPDHNKGTKYHQVTTDYLETAFPGSSAATPNWAVAKQLWSIYDKATLGMKAWIDSRSAEALAKGNFPPDFFQTLLLRLDGSLLKKQMGVEVPSSELCRKIALAMITPGQIARYQSDYLKNLLVALHDAGKFDLTTEQTLASMLDLNSNDVTPLLLAYFKDRPVNDRAVQGDLLKLMKTGPTPLTPTQAKIRSSAILALIAYPSNLELLRALASSMTPDGDPIGDQLILDYLTTHPQTDGQVIASVSSLLTSKTPFTRQAVARALGALAGNSQKEYLQSLILILKTKELYLQNAVAPALSKMIIPDSDILKGIITSAPMLDPKITDLVRANLVSQVETFRTSGLLNDVIPFLTGPAGSEVNLAEDLLVAGGAKDLTLQRALAGLVSQGYFNAGQLLARIHSRDPETMALVKKAAQSSVANVRRAALEAASTSDANDVDGLQALIAGMSDDSPGVRAMTARSLAKSGSTDTSVILAELAALTDKDPSVSVEVQAQLSGFRTGDKDLLRKFLALRDAKDQSDAVKKVASRVLSSASNSLLASLQPQAPGVLASCISAALMKLGKALAVHPVLSSCGRKPADSSTSAAASATVESAACKTAFGPQPRAKFLEAFPSETTLADGIDKVLASGPNALPSEFTGYLSGKDHTSKNILHMLDVFEQSNPDLLDEPAKKLLESKLSEADNWLHDIKTENSGLFTALGADDSSEITLVLARREAAYLEENLTKGMQAPEARKAARDQARKEADSALKECAK